MCLRTSFLRMIRSLTLIVVLQNQGQSPILILIEMFSLETLFFAVPVTGIASLCGLVVLHRLLIYPLVAIIGPLLWSGGHQCVRRRSQSHWLLGSAGLGDGHLWLLIHRELVSPPFALSQNVVSQGQRAPKDAFDLGGISGYGAH